MARAKPKDGDQCGRRMKDGGICKGELVVSNHVATKTGIAEKLRCFDCGAIRIGQEV